MGMTDYLAQVQLEASDLQLVGAPAHLIIVHMARIIGLMCSPAWPSLRPVPPGSIHLRL